jgi:uncharacterized protein (DUF2236 family)
MHDPVSQRVNAERIVVLGWSRAILLQLAHPLVAAGVAEHSHFRSGSLSTIARLHHTIRAMLALTFGNALARDAALDGIKAIHRRVHGRLSTAAGIFPAGTVYSAEDPDIVLWVHATLLETIPMMYELVVRPLSADERDAYCAEAAPVAVDLGARSEDVPRTWPGVAAYLDRVYASGAIVVSAQAREVAAAVLSPPFAPFVAPVAWGNRLFTVGLLPADIRRQYGFEWNDSRDRTLRRLMTTVRAIRRTLPPAVALWPEARHVSST